MTVGDDTVESSSPKYDVVPATLDLPAEPVVESTAVEAGNDAASVEIVADTVAVE